MRILYSHYLADDVHPAAQMVHAIAQEMSRMGHEVKVHRSTGPAKPSAGSSGSRKPSFAHRLRNRLWFARAIARNRAMIRRDLKAIDAFQPDVILARQDAYCVSMAIAALRRGIPLVTYADAPVAYETRIMNGNDGRWHPPGLVETLEKWTLRHSEAVVTVSGPAASLLERYDSGTPIHVVPNGVDPSRFQRLSDKQRVEARRAIGITAPRVAGFVGSFKAFHGINRLREMIQTIGPRADTQWLLIGDGPERTSIEASLADRTDVISLGRRPAAEVGRLLSLMDVAVVPHPRFAGDFYFCPLKVLESAAAGCAIVASDQGDIRNLLDNGRSGVVLSSDDIPSWSDSIEELLDAPDRAKGLGESARRHILSQSTWEQTARRVADVLKDAIESHAAHSHNDAAYHHDEAETTRFLGKPDRFVLDPK